MNRRPRPHWPLLVRTATTPEGDVDPKLTPVETALIDEFALAREQPGYDPYNTSAGARQPRPRPLAPRNRR